MEWNLTPEGDGGQGVCVYVREGEGDGELFNGKETIKIKPTE